MTVRERDLKVGPNEKIGEGGFGEVFRVPSTFSLPGQSGPLAYKKPKPGPASGEVLAAMATAVRFRDSLTPAERDTLDEYTAWPVAMVQNLAGRDCGLLMPLLDGRFQLATRPQGAPPKDVLFEFAWLSAKDSQVRQQGIDRSAAMDTTVRLILLARLVYIVAWLHRRGVVYGDISLKNTIIATNPAQVRLIDCDGTAPVTDPNQRQGHSPFFFPPECRSGSLQDTRSDVYKLGLCLIRGLQWGPGVTQTAKPDSPALAAALDPAGITLLRRAVSSDPAQRPSAKELYACLAARIGALVTPPDLVGVSLDRTTMPRGMEVRVRWRIAHAERIVITGGRGLHVDVTDPARYPNGISVRPLGSGDIDVEVFNRNGSVRATAGAVDLYELPVYNVDLSMVPALRLPPLPEVEVPEVLSSLPPVPAVSTYEHPVPRVESPSMETVLEVLRPLSGLGSPLLRVDSVVADGLEQIQTVVADEIRTGLHRISQAGIADAGASGPVPAGAGSGRNTI